MQLTEFSSLRLKTGLSINELATQLDYNPRQLYRWENGESEPRTPVLEMLKQLAASNLEQNGDRNHFTFIDLFAGIGGLRKAFDDIGGYCVFTSEWDKYAQQTYAANFRDNRPVEGDIRQLDHRIYLTMMYCLQDFRASLSPLQEYQKRTH